MLSDFDYDVLQKKRLTASARRRVCGSKSHRCTLPSDRLTPAQLKRRNGPVNTYKLDAPMTWEQFLAMPEDLQRKYLTDLRELYRATDDMLGRMFHVHPTAVSKRRNLLGITGATHRTSVSEKETIEAKWQAFCNGVLGGTPCGEPLPPEATESREEHPSPANVAAEVVPEPLNLTGLLASFTGEFDAEQFFRWVAKLPIPEGRVRISVEVTAL